MVAFLTFFPYEMWDMGTFKCYTKVRNKSLKSIKMEERSARNSFGRERGGIGRMLNDGGGW